MHCAMGQSVHSEVPNTATQARAAVKTRYGCHSSNAQTLQCSLMAAHTLALP